MESWYLEDKIQESMLGPYPSKILAEYYVEHFLRPVKQHLDKKSNATWYYDENGMILGKVFSWKDDEELLLSAGKALLELLSRDFNEETRADLCLALDKINNVQKREEYDH